MLLTKSVPGVVTLTLWPENMAVSPAGFGQRIPRRCRVDSTLANRARLSKSPALLAGYHA